MADQLKGLRYRRRSAEKTQAEAAEVIGLTTSHYSRIEKGQATLTLERAVKLAAWLGCDAEDLL